MKNSPTITVTKNTILQPCPQSIVYTQALSILYLPYSQCHLKLLFLNFSDPNQQLTVTLWMSEIIENGFKFEGAVAKESPYSLKNLVLLKTAPRIR